MTTSQAGRKSHKDWAGPGEMGKERETPRGDWVSNYRIQMKSKHILISYFNYRLNVISVSEEEACKFESTGMNEVKSIVNYNKNNFMDSKKSTL